MTTGQVPEKNVGTGAVCTIPNEDDPGRSFSVDAGYVVAALLDQGTTDTEAVFVGASSVDFEQPAQEGSCVLDFISQGPVELTRVYAGPAEAATFEWGSAEANKFEVGEFRCHADSSDTKESAGGGGTEPGMGTDNEIRGWGAVCESDDVSFALLPDWVGTWTLEQLQAAVTGLVAGSAGPSSGPAELPGEDPGDEVLADGDLGDGDGEGSEGVSGYSAEDAEQVIRGIYAAAAVDDCATITNLSTPKFQELLGCSWLSAMRGTIEVNSVEVNITKKDVVTREGQDAWTSVSDIETFAYDGEVVVVLVRGPDGWLVAHMAARD